MHTVLSYTYSYSFACLKQLDIAIYVKCKINAEKEFSLATAGVAEILALLDWSNYVIVGTENAWETLPLGKIH